MNAIITVFQSYEWVFALGFVILAITGIYEYLTEK